MVLYALSTFYIVYIFLAYGDFDVLIPTTWRKVPIYILSMYFDVGLPTFSKYIVQEISLCLIFILMVRLLLLFYYSNILSHAEMTLKVTKRITILARIWWNFFWGSDHR